jgi:hypothetical protein
MRISTTAIQDTKLALRNIGKRRPRRGAESRGSRRARKGGREGEGEGSQTDRPTDRPTLEKRASVRKKVVRMWGWRACGERARMAVLWETIQKERSTATRRPRRNPGPSCRAYGFSRSQKLPPTPISPPSSPASASATAVGLVLVRRAGVR